MLKAAVRFSHLPSGEKWLAVEACAWFCVARLAIRLLPFRVIASALGKHMHETPDAIEAEQSKVAKQIQKAVGRVGRSLPWGPKCFDHALSAKAMLVRRRIPSTLYFGVKRSQDQRLLAHAWVRCGNQILTGAKGSSDFAVVSSFGERL